MLLACQEEHLKAEELQRIVIANSIAAFGKDDERVRAAKANIAMSLRETKDPIKVAEARKIEKEVHEACLQNLVENSPEMIRSFATMAHDLSTQGKLYRAAKLQKKVLVLTEQQFGDETDQFRKAAITYAHTLSRLGRNDDAVSVLRRAVRSAALVFGTGSPLYEATVGFLHQELTDQNKQAEAASVRTQAITFGA